MSFRHNYHSAPTEARCESLLLLTRASSSRTVGEEDVSGHDAVAARSVGSDPEVVDLPADGERHRPQVDGKVGRIGDQVSVRGKEGARVVEALFDVGRLRVGDGSVFDLSCGYSECRRRLAIEVS